MTESARDVRALNERARAERLLLDGAVDQHEVDLGDGCRASVGDIVITRQNDRRIRTMRGGWVKNGDRWQVTDIRRDGSVVVKRLGAAAVAERPCSRRSTSPNTSTSVTPSPRTVPRASPSTRRTSW